MIEKIRLIVVCLIIKDNQILIGKKYSQSEKALAGKWHIPGGEYDPEKDGLVTRLSFTQIITNTAQREMKAETNLNIQVDRVLKSSDLKKSAKNEFLNMFWLLCSPVPDFSARRVGEDLEEIELISINEVLTTIDQLALHTMPTGVKSFLENY